MTSEELKITNLFIKLPIEAIAHRLNQSLSSDVDDLDHFTFCDFSPVWDSARRIGMKCRFKTYPDAPHGAIWTEVLTTHPDNIEEIANVFKLLDIRSKDNISVSRDGFGVQLRDVTLLLKEIGNFKDGEPDIRTAKFSIGQIVKHRIFPFRGVVFDVDLRFDYTEEWLESIPEEIRPSKDQPFYHLFAENDDTEYVAYVSEQNLVEDDSKETMRNLVLNDLDLKYDDKLGMFLSAGKPN